MKRVALSDKCNTAYHLVKDGMNPLAAWNQMIEQLYDNKDIYGSDFNEDESKILIGTNMTGIYNVGELNIADTSVTMLTKSSKDACFAVRYIPGTNFYMYSTDNGGDENSHLYLAGKNDTIVKDVTPWPNSANSFAGWSDDKKAMYISSNKRNVKYFDLWKMDVATWNPTLIYQNDSSYDVSLISHTERFLVLTKSITTDKNELFIYDRTNKILNPPTNLPSQGSPGHPSGSKP